MFISPAWKYNSDYKNYSVPRHDPVIDPNSDAGRKTLTLALDNQIRPVNCVLIISGMYVSNKYWLQKEISLAKSYKKPIIGLVPWGQDRTPSDVQTVAIEMVGWNSNSIVSAIRKHSL